MIDRLFDTLNSRNPCAKGFKAPLGALNWAERVAFFLRAREYLITLSVKDGTPFHRSKRSFKTVTILFCMKFKAQVHSLLSSHILHISDFRRERGPKSGGCDTDGSVTEGL